MHLVNGAVGGEAHQLMSQTDAEHRNGRLASQKLLEVVHRFHDGARIAGSIRQEEACKAEGVRQKSLRGLV